MKTNMTNIDKSFQFANANCDKYENDEDPLNALRDGFLCGCEWKDKQFDLMIHHFWCLIKDGIPFERAYKQVTGKNWRNED